MISQWNHDILLKPYVNKKNFKQTFFLGTFIALNVRYNIIHIYIHISGVDSQVFKRGGALWRPPWLAEEQSFRLQMVWKGKSNARNHTFFANISIRIFKFSPFLCTMNACQWNLINFSKFANAFITKEKKHLWSGQWEKKICWTLFYNRLFYNVL